MPQKSLKTNCFKKTLELLMISMFESFSKITNYLFFNGLAPQSTCK
jgi:hypothetical protein